MMENLNLLFAQKIRFIGDRTLNPNFLEFFKNIGLDYKKVFKYDVNSKIFILIDTKPSLSNLEIQLFPSMDIMENLQGKIEYSFNAWGLDNSLREKNRLKRGYLYLNSNKVLSSKKISEDKLNNYLTPSIVTHKSLFN